MPTIKIDEAELMKYVAWGVKLVFSYVPWWFWVILAIGPVIKMSRKR